MKLNDIKIRDLADQDPLSEDNLRDRIVSYLLTDKSVTDSEFHQLADGLGIPPEKLEEVAYKMMQELLRRVGKHNATPDTEFDPQELEKGIKVEREHTGSDYIAKMIAKDHLKEMPDYYTKLLQMEKE